MERILNTMLRSWVYPGLVVATLAMTGCGGRSGMLWGQRDDAQARDRSRADLPSSDSGPPDLRNRDLRQPDYQISTPDLGPVPKEWTVTFGGSGPHQVKALAVDGPGAIYVTGAYSGKANFGSHACVGHGSYDIFLAGLGKDGSFRWALCGGGSGFDSGIGLAVGPGGDLWLSGEFNGKITLGGVTITSSASSDLFLARVSPAGKVRWVATGGGAGLDQGIAVTVDTTSGTAYLAGSVTAAAAFGPHKIKASGLENSIFARVTAAGAFAWVVGAVSDTWSRPVALRLAANGALYVAGNFGAKLDLGGHILKGTGIDHGFLARLDSAGKVAWAVAATGPQSTKLSAIDADLGGAVYVTGKYKGSMSLGNLKAAGPTGSTLFDRILVARLSPSGVGAWLLTDKGDGYPFDQGRVVRASRAPTAPLYLLGYTGAPSDLGGHKIKDKGPFVARLSAGGKATWSKSLAPRDGTLMELDAVGGVYLAQEVYNGSLMVYKITP